MTQLKKLFLIAICISASASLHAQLEVAQIFTNGHSYTGFGGNLHVGFPVAKGDELSGEIGIYYFAPSQSHMVFVPFLLGYRHTFDHSGTGFYVEPIAGYSIGATDIPRVDANGQPIYNSDGSEVDQKLSGATVGAGIGYILHNANLPLNFGLRFEHIFVSDNPSPNVLAFRVSWSVLTARRLAAH
ncbi:hypothetical protein [Puia sp.]|jgi:hypothetical protein|uniref:hypothetical protein n=1 Tax=Puia sp. TaxID=2045100 RepID=UPI002F405491